MNRFIALLFAALFGLAIAGCDTNEGPMEETGEQFDEAGEEAAEGLDEAGDEVEKQYDEATEN